jgi:hypothetical protein
LDKKEVEFWRCLYGPWALEIIRNEHSIGIRFRRGWVVIFEDRFLVFFDKDKNWGYEIVTADPFELAFELLVRQAKAPRSVKHFLKKHARKGA